MAFKESYRNLFKRFAKTSAHLLLRFNMECFFETGVTGSSAKNQWPHWFPSNTSSPYFETRDICRLTAIEIHLWAQFPAAPFNHYSPVLDLLHVPSFFSMALRPNAGHGLLTLEVSRSHTATHHSRKDSSVRVISASRRPLPHNTQHSQQTDIHAPVGFKPTISAGERP